MLSDLWLIIWYMTAVQMAGCLIIIVVPEVVPVMEESCLIWCLWFYFSSPPLQLPPIREEELNRPPCKPAVEALDAAIQIQGRTTFRYPLMKLTSIIWELFSPSFDEDGLPRHELFSLYNFSAFFFVTARVNFGTYSKFVVSSSCSSSSISNNSSIGGGGGDCGSGGGGDGSRGGGVGDIGNSNSGGNSSSSSSNKIRKWFFVHLPYLGSSAMAGVQFFFLIFA